MSKKDRIAVQLYSVREEMQKDLGGTLKELAGTGYSLVEPAGFAGLSASDFAKALNDHGMSVPSMHYSLPVGDDKNKIIDEAAVLGAKYIITGGPALGWESWKSLDGIKKLAEVYNEAAALAAKHGMKVGFHNHDKEMHEVEGRPAYEHFLELAEPEVVWEVDTYWVKVGGVDPVEAVINAGERVKLLHIKDGPCIKTEPMTAVGEGVMDIPPILDAANASEIFCVELDSCATDMMEAVRQSYAALAEMLS